MSDSHPRVTFVFGGARSGKSTFAEKLALARFRHPLYLATAEHTDAEMDDRIARHQARRGEAWGCHEEPLDVASAIANAAPECDGILLECLSTWLGNVLYHANENAWEERRAVFLDALRNTSRGIVVIGNEVGMGIVPATPLGRQFRDLNGWLNQAVAAVADEVIFVAAGLPLWLKGAPAMQPTKTESAGWFG